MSQELANVKIGLALVLLCLSFGIGMGITFGVNEDMYKDRIAEQVAANPAVHKANSESRIWRYAQRAHFHATGIAAFSLGLIILVMFSNMKAGMKKLSSILIGLGGFYPLAWFSMYLLAPTIGPGAAHGHIMTELFTYVGVLGLVLGMAMLMANLFLGSFREA